VAPACPPPIVVNEGDRVQVTFVNGATKALRVTLPHSIDLHGAAVAPNVAFRTPRVSGHVRFSFTAAHPRRLRVSLRRPRPSCCTWARAWSD